MEVYSSPSRRASSWARSMTRLARGSSAELAALDAGAPREDGRELAAERGQVHAQAPERLGGDAVVGLDERGEQVLRVEHGALHPLGELLGGDDGLLGLLGEAVELHGSGSRGSVGRGRDRVAGPGRAQLAARGSGWSTRSRNACAASFCLVVERGGQHDADLHVQVARARRPSASACPGREAERLAALCPGRDREEHRPLSVVTGTSPPSSASRSVTGSSRSRSAPRRVVDGVRANAHGHDDVAAVGALAAQPDAAAGVDAARDLDLVALALHLDHPAGPVEGLLEGELGRRLDRRRRPRASRLPVRVPASGGRAAVPPRPMSPRMSSNAGPPPPWRRAARSPRDVPAPPRLRRRRPQRPRRTSGRSRRSRRRRAAGRPELVPDAARLAAGRPAPARPPNPPKPANGPPGPNGSAPPRPPPARWYCSQFAPSASYCLRLSGSERTAFASLTSLNRFSAAVSPGFRSGWCSRASFRNAFLMSAWLADLGTPRIS